MKWSNMKKPRPPKKPLEPIYPDTHKRNIKLSYYHDDEYSIGATVDHISKEVSTNYNQSFDINRLFIKLECGYYNDYSLETYYSIDIPKTQSDYNKELREYNNKMLVYQTKLKQYKQDYRQFLQERKKYKQFLEKQELDKKRKLYEELKKEFNHA